MNSNFSDVAGWCVDAHVCFGSALFRTLLNVLRFLCAAYTSVCCLLERRMHTHTGIDTVARRGGNKRTKQNEATEIRLIYNVVFFFSASFWENTCATLQYFRSCAHSIHSKFIISGQGFFLQNVYIFISTFIWRRATTDTVNKEEKKTLFLYFDEKLSSTEIHINSNRAICVLADTREREY